METLKFFGYGKCGTCRSALKHLAKLGREVEQIDITTQPPAAGELAAILDGGSYSLRQLFNTSGGMYREMNMKDRLTSMGQDEAINLLGSEGMLVKRPIVTDGRRYTVGYDAATYDEVWGK